MARRALRLRGFGGSVGTVGWGSAQRVPLTICDMCIGETPNLAARACGDDPPAAYASRISFTEPRDSFVVRRFREFSACETQRRLPIT